MPGGRVSALICAAILVCFALPVVAQSNGLLQKEFIDRFNLWRQKVFPPAGALLFLALNDSVTQARAFHPRSLSGLISGSPPESMPMLVWNDAAAAIANNYTQQCTFEHNKNRGPYGALSHLPDG